jgi:hypothetical protein
MGDAFEVQRVVGCGDTQVVVTNTVFFLRKCKIVIADAVESIRKTVLIDTCRVLFDKVLLTGRLRKEITLTERAECASNVAAVSLVQAEVNFQAVIDIRGARPGDTCVVVKAFVEGEEERPLTCAPRGGIKGLLDSSVLFLCVKLLRSAMVKRDREDHAGDGCHYSGSFAPFSDDADVCGQSVSDPFDGSSSCPLAHHGKRRRERDCWRCAHRRTTGLVIGGSDGVPDAHPGLVPGSFVGPTILFPGVM